jgi:hypothetical protein
MRIRKLIKEIKREFSRKSKLNKKKKELRLKTNKIKIKCQKHLKLKVTQNKHLEILLKIKRNRRNLKNNNKSKTMSNSSKRHQAKILITRINKITQISILIKNQAKKIKLTRANNNRRINKNNRIKISKVT